jgi:hypothetical protein
MNQNSSLRYIRRSWESRDTADRYYRAEGFIVGASICRRCGHTLDCAILPETNRRQLQCIYCGACDSSFDERREE